MEAQILQMAQNMLALAQRVDSMLAIMEMQQALIAAQAAAFDARLNALERASNA